MSKQTQAVVDGAAETLGRLFTMGRTPLQILVLMETRWQEYLAKTPGQHVFTNTVINAVREKYVNHGTAAPHRQGCWDALQSLRDRGLLYIAPPGKRTSKRAVCLTARSDVLFKYPRSIQLY